jgi:hypothetical protein
MRFGIGTEYMVSSDELRVQVGYAVRVSEK